MKYHYIIVSLVALGSLLEWERSIAGPRAVPSSIAPYTPNGSSAASLEKTRTSRLENMSMGSSSTD